MRQNHNLDAAGSIPAPVTKFQEPCGRQAPEILRGPPRSLFGQVEGLEGQEPRTAPELHAELHQAGQRDPAGGLEEEAVAEGGSGGHPAPPELEAEG